MPVLTTRVRRSWWLLGAVTLLTVSACGSGENDINAPPATVSATVLGLAFSVTGTVAAAVDGALPSAAASFAGPVSTLNRRPTPTTSATITVAALEPFNTVLILPGGATQYVRIALPSTTTLIGVNVIGVAGAVATATTVTVAVANGARVSQGTPLALQALGN